MSLSESPEIPLNPEQEAAVLHEGGPLLVLAPAGSGKTRVVIERLIALIDRSGVGGEGFFVATFTRKAAGELSERITRRIPGARLPWVGTFHSLSARLLRRFSGPAGLSPDFTIFDAGDQKALVREIMRRHRISDEDVNPQDVLRQIGRWKNARQGPGPGLAQRLFGTNRWFATCYEEYEKGLEASRALDYDDLLLRLVALLGRSPEVSGELRKQFHHILVDEYQDTNPLQEELIRLLSRNRTNVTVVGDDDQSIYQFRGADITHIRSFAENYPGARRVLLFRNYRSTPTIITAASSVIARNGKRYEKEVQAVRGTGVPVLLKELSSEDVEAEYVCRMLREWTRGGGRLGESAVLFRTHAQALPIEKALSLAGIPFYRKGGGGFLEGREVKDLLAYLRVMANPFDRVSLSRILNVPARGQGEKAQEILRRLGEIQPGATAPELLERLALEQRRGGSLPELAALLREGGERARSGELPRTLLEEVLVRTDYRGWVSMASHDLEEREKRLEVISELLRMSEAFSPSPEGDRLPLSSFLEEIALAQQEPGNPDDGGRVALMTIHQSKGLEFDQVFVVGLEDQILPLRGKSPTDIEEERRLFYVAMTRARSHLHLSWCQTRRIYGRTYSHPPSPFLRDIPPHLVEGDLPSVARPERDASPARPRDFRRPWMESPGRTLGRKEAAVPGRTMVRQKTLAPTEPGRSDPEKVRARRPEWIGRKVLHPRFGPGEVMDAFSPDPDLEVVIRFSDGTSRTLLARVANLTILEG